MVIQKSRRASQLYEQQTGIGGDFNRMSGEMRQTLSTICEYDKPINTALTELDNAKYSTFSSRCYSKPSNTKYFPANI
jgi:hypothetical protein